MKVSAALFSLAVILTQDFALAEAGCEAPGFFSNDLGSDEPIVVGALRGPDNIAPVPSFEHAEYYKARPIDAQAFERERCYFSSRIGTPTTDPGRGAFALADNDGQIKPAARAKLANVAEEAYASRTPPPSRFRALRPEDTAALHTAEATVEVRARAIRSVATADVMSAAAHEDLRDPGKVFFFARMIKIAAEPGQHPAEESAKANQLMVNFQKEPIQINVFTSVKDGKVVVDHVECVDGNHRLAAGLVAGKWLTIADIPANLLDVRVNGSRARDRPAGVAEKDLHWVPSRVTEDSAFRKSFREISVAEFQGRVQRNGGRYDANLLAESEFFHVPEEWGTRGGSVALRPEIASNHSGMGRNTGVPMWMVIRKTLIRDKILAESDFESGSSCLRLQTAM